MKHTRFILRIVIAALLVCAGLILVGAWWTLERPLPQLDGTVIVPELGHAVTVDRDRWGVPWIRAKSEEDMATAQGYVTAQDRLWQLDLLRRAAGGQLAEIFGPIALASDRENRTLGMREAAEAAASAMGPESRAILESYARGVNRFIAQHQGRLPIEFRLLGYAPRPWRPADTFLVEAFMYKALTTTWKAEMERAEITAKIGPERAKELYPVDSPLDHLVVGAPRGTRPSSASPAGSLRNEALPRRFPVSAASLEWQEARVVLAGFNASAEEALGSNNFVVSGAHTYSGKPLLANDTHLPLTVPDIWYIAHLTTPGWNVEGFALPGVPLVIIGHNDRIAWGFTNSMIDVQDLYIETFHPASPLQYRANGKWLTAQTRREVIRIKGQPDDVLDVTVTRHGPVVAREGNRGYALRWTATEPGGLDARSLRFGQARNWDEFREDLRHFTGPGQNIVYADADGNIGYFLPQWIPIRASGDGSVPVPGNTDAYEWKGYVPFHELPQAFNPPGGIIATANARNVGPAYKYFLTDRWEAPYRTARLYQLLDGRAGLRPADCNAIQNDIVSLPNLFLARQLVRAAEARPPKDHRLRQIIGRLANWDGRATRASAETALLETLRRRLLANLLTPLLGADADNYNWWRHDVFLNNILVARPVLWLPKGYADYDGLLVKSAEQAAEDLAKETRGDNPTGWQWGAIHRLDMLHPVGRGWPLHWLLSIGPLAENGTAATVRAMRPHYGPAMRFVADVANWDDSMMEIATGESGQAASPHYRDQFPGWFSGRGIIAPFSAAAEERARVHRLVLVPGAKPAGR